MDKVTSISKVIATILAALAVMGIAIFLVAVNLQQYLMNPQTYKDVFAQQELYQRIPALIAGQLTENLNQSDGNQADEDPAVFLSLDTDDWTLILEEVLDEDWSQRQVETVIDGVFTLLNGEVETVQIPISLQELKIALKGPEGQNILKLMFGRLPDCTLQDVSDFAARLIFEGNLELPACSLPDEVLDPVLGQVHKLLFPAIGLIPDTLQISLSRSDFDTTNPLRPDKTINLVDRYQTVQEVIRYGPWGVALLLALIAAIVVRSWRDLLNWWGWTLFLGGVVIWLPIPTGGNLYARLIENYLAVNAPRIFSPEVVGMAVSITGQIVREMFIPIREQSGIVSATGFALLAAAFILKKREELASPQTGQEN